MSETQSSTATSSAASQSSSVQLSNPNSSDSRGFQIGLRTMLIVLLTAGSIIGVWGRLYMTQPEVALFVLMLCSTVLPFLFAIILLFRLAPSAKSPSLIRLAATMCLLLPFVGGLATTLLARFGMARMGPMGLANLSTDKLIKQELPGKIDEPWVWDELENRLARKVLKNSEVNEAVQVLIKHMKTTAPEGYNKPLSWQGDFLVAAREGGNVNQELLFQVYEAFLPSGMPELDRVRDDAKQTSISIDYGSTWADHRDLGFKLLAEISDVRVNGASRTLKDSFKHRRGQSSELVGPFEKGEHELEVEVMYAFIETSKLVGLDASALPSTQWPTALKTWSKVYKSKLHVLGADEPGVELVKGVRKPVVIIERLLVQKLGNSEKTRISLTLGPIDYELPVSFSVVAEYEGQEFYIGRMYYYSTSKTTSRSGDLSRSLKEPLPKDCREVTLIFRPDPKGLDREPEATKMFGDELRYYNVKVERFDLKEK